MSDIRADLKEVEAQVSRLLAIGDAFRTKDRDWSHLRNREDWGRNIPQIKDGLKQAKIERVYCEGRDMAGFMAEALLAVNYDVTRYPTLTSIVERFKETWVYLDLDPVVADAQRIHAELGLNCWAFNQMVLLFKEQQELAHVVRQTLDLLKDSDLYKKENGLPIDKDTPSFSIGNVTGSNVSIGSNSVSQTIKGSTAVFSELREAIQASGIEDKEPLMQAVESMEAAHGSSGFTRAYQQFMAFAADHMTVLAPFMATLAAML